MGFPLQIVWRNRDLCGLSFYCVLRPVPPRSHTHTKKTCLQTSLGGQCLRHNASTVADMDRSLVGELRSPTLSAAKKWKKQKLKKNLFKKKACLRDCSEFGRTFCILLAAFIGWASSSFQVESNAHEVINITFLPGKKRQRKKPASSASVEKTFQMWNDLSL